MGLDQKPLVKGLQSAQGQVQQFGQRITKDFEKFAGDMAGRVMSMLRTNLYLGVVSLLERLLPTAEEFWDSVYGNSQEQTQAFERTRQKFRTLREELMESKKLVDQKWADLIFGEATDQGKLDIINKQLKEITREQEQQLYLFNRFKDSGPNSSFIEIATKARTKLNELESQAFDLERKADKIKADILKKEEAIARAKAKQIDAVRDAILAEQAAAGAMGRAVSDRSGSTLSDIANSTEGFWRHNPRIFRNEFVGAPGKQAAQEVMRLEEQARRAALFGNQTEADKLTNRALELRRSAIPGLSASERDPLGVMRAKMDEAQFKVNEALAKAITPEGLKVTPGD